MDLWMLLWGISFGLLALSSCIGMILFFGYTFRVRIHYPMTLVVLHLVISALTSVLYVVCIIWRIITHTSESWIFSSVLVGSGVMVVLTFVVGLAFFLQFNMKGITLAGRFIGLHVTMASVTFIMLIASTIFVTQSSSHHKGNYPSSNYNYYKHLHMRERTNSASRGGSK